MHELKTQAEDFESDILDAQLALWGEPAVAEPTPPDRAAGLPPCLLGNVQFETHYMDDGRSVIRWLIGRLLSHDPEHLIHAMQEATAAGSQVRIPLGMGRAAIVDTAGMTLDWQYTSDGLDGDFRAPLVAIEETRA